MTPEERAEKIVKKYSGQYSLIAAKEEIAAQIREAAEEAIVNLTLLREGIFKAEAYKDAANIAKYHYGCGTVSTETDEIAEKILSRIENRCRCMACKTISHLSDCAVHNEPALENWECDCRAREKEVAK
jgi:hypothetical protein